MMKDGEDRLERLEGRGKGDAMNVERPKRPRKEEDDEKPV